LAVSVFDDLMRFLERLEAASIRYSLGRIRPNCLLVSVVVPGQRWEVEFLADGNVEIETFVSDGTILDRSALDDLISQFSD
jgi:hypothetical protein